MKGEVMENYISILGLPLVIFVLILWFVLWFIKTSNSLNRYQVKIKESKKNVDIALAKRYDTICEMIKVVKSFSKHEKTTFTDVIKLRQNNDIESANKEIRNQNKIIDHIYALAEAYPDLKSSKEYLRLQEEIDDENEQLAAAKRIVNSNISMINQKIVSFPISLVAKSKGMKEFDFLEEEDLDRKKYINNFNY